MSPPGTTVTPVIHHYTIRFETFGTLNSWKAPGEPPSPEEVVIAIDAKHLVPDDACMPLWAQRSPSSWGVRARGLVPVASPWTFSAEKLLIRSIRWDPQWQQTILVVDRQLLRLNAEAAVLLSICSGDQWNGVASLPVHFDGNPNLNRADPPGYIETQERF